MDGTTSVPPKWGESHRSSSRSNIDLDNSLAIQHAQLCQGLVGLTKEVQDFQLCFDNLREKLNLLQSHAQAGDPQQADARKISFLERRQSRSSTRNSLETTRSSRSNTHSLVQSPVHSRSQPISDLLAKRSTPSVSSHSMSPSQTDVGNCKRLSDRYSLRSLSPPPVMMEANTIHLDDEWIELYFRNEKEAEEQLEKIYLAVRQEEFEIAIALTRSSGTSGSKVSSFLPSCRLRLKKYFLHPSSRRRVFWDFVGMMLLIWDITSIPIQVAWNLTMHAGSFMNVMFLITLVYWTLDILLTFLTATYTPDGQLTTSFKLIAFKYAQTWLAIDLAVVALDWAIAIIGDASALSSIRVIRIIRIVRLVRIMKFNKLERQLEDFFITTGRPHLALSLSFIKIALCVLVVLHGFGCLLFLVGRESQEMGEPNLVNEYFVAKGINSGAHQYMKCFHWMLCQFSPAPFPWVAQNDLEQATLLLAIIVGMPVIGSSLSSLISLVSQMNAQASENTRTKRQLEQYIMVNNFPDKLSARILRYVEHKLQKMGAAVQRPKALALLPPHMIAELSLAELGRALMIHPFISLIMDAKLDIVSEVCAAFKLLTTAPDTDVFAAGSVSKGMYITSLGNFDLQYQGKSRTKSSQEVTFEHPCLLRSAPQDPRQRLRRSSSKLLDMTVQKSLSNQTPTTVSFSDAQWFAELSLFTSFSHTTTLRSTTFGEVYSISAEDFEDAIKGSPISIVAAHQYAKALLERVNAGEVRMVDSLPAAYCRESCRLTQLSAAVFPSPEGASKGLPELEGMSHREAVDLVEHQEFMSGLIVAKTVEDETLQAMFPELHMDHGTYKQFDHMGERRCSVLGIRSAIWLAGDNYDAMTSVQEEDPETCLTHKTWLELQDFMKWVDLDADLLHGALVFLTIRGLGKSKSFNHMCPPPARRCPEYGIAYIMQEMRRFVPSVQILPTRLYELVQAALLLNKDFSFDEFVQGVNLPYNVYLLEEIVQQERPELLKFYLFVNVCMMCGSSGTASLEGSAFLNEQNATNLLNGLRQLQKLGDVGPQIIYWGYVKKRASKLGVGSRTPEELAFARLICVTHTVDKEDLGILQEAWNNLSIIDQQCLVRWFTADGITAQSFICDGLRNYFRNAIDNPVIGLHLAMTTFLDLLDRLEKYMDNATAMVYTVDLADLAAIIADVKAPQGLGECIQNCKILQNDTRFLLVLTRECRQAAAKTTWRGRLTCHQHPALAELQLHEASI